MIRRDKSLPRVRWCWLLAALAVSVVPAGALAQDESEAPVVVKAVPEAGAKAVDSATKEIRVTFNRDMLDGSWSWTQNPDRGEFPEVTGKIHYLKDRRTCVLPVKLIPGRKYFIGVNSERHRNFKDVEGRPAVPYPLNFTTNE